MLGRQLEHAVFGLVAAFGIALSAGGQGDESGFIKEAIQGNLAEVQLAELALQRAENQEIRRFGETLRQDHSAALQRATNIAKSLKVDAPTEPTADAKRKYEVLTQLSSSEFDAAFVSHIVVAHEGEIARYNTNANSNDDAVAAYIAESLPKMKAHLAKAQALQKDALDRSSR